MKEGRCHEIVKFQCATLPNRICPGLCATGLTTNHAGTAKSTCCILFEIKSFLLLSDVTNVTQINCAGAPDTSIFQAACAWFNEFLQATGTVQATIFAHRWLSNVTKII